MVLRDDLSRYQRVSSLYGPGTVACWLMAVCSVLISWTLNKKQRKKDSINNDFIAALVLPGVAAGHLIYQIIRFLGKRLEIISTTDEKLISYAAAIEAPLNVCETFSALALCLVVIAISHNNLKRAVSVFAVGMLSFGAELVLFVQGPVIDLPASNMTRPFSINIAGFVPIVIGMLGLLILTIPAFYVYILISRMVSEESQDRGDDNAPAHRSEHRPGRRALQLSSIYSSLVLPLALVSTSSIALGAWGETAIGVSNNFDHRLRFFIPKTGISILALDQAVALAGGVTTLALCLYSTYKSYNMESEA